MADLFRCAGGGQLAFGVVSLMSGILAFFPMVSYKPWYVGWSTKIAAPLWTGLLALVAGTCVLLASKKQNNRAMWELSYTFSILCVLICPVQFAVAAAATMTGPFCYYSFFGAVGTGYLGYVVVFPYPYLRFRDLCLDPLRMEWYHLGLQIADLLCGAVVFVLSLAIAIGLTRRLLRQGHVNKI